VSLVDISIVNMPIIDGTYVNRFCDIIAYTSNGDIAYSEIRGKMTSRNNDTTVRTYVVDKRRDGVIVAPFQLVEKCKH